MTFAVICIVALAALGGIAILFSLGGKDDPVVTDAPGCANCASNDGTCKIACLMEEAKAKKQKPETESPPLSKGKAGVALLGLLALLAACSTQKNTPKSRWWHSFNARYNTYYNGNVAYIDGSLEKEQGNKDNFTEIIPLYTVSNKNSKTLGKGNFDKAIEKAQKAIKLHSIKRRPEWNKSRKKTERDIEWLSRREYNPFLWKAWMLMGRSQFHQGSFDEAASTFAYMARLYHTQPAIYGKARAWLAKCYIEQDWLYDAEDVITKMRRDSLDWRAVKEWDYTYADYYIHTQRYEEAIPYLRKVIRHEMRRKQKAREWFLLGQLYAAIGKKPEAYKAFRHVVRMNPPYELDFNARIAMSEVMAGGNPKKTISQLKSMARSDKNAEYLDQVYYAMGNVYLMQKDTLKAISAYEKGNEKATRSGIEKGVLLLHLGDLYWEMEKFSDAKRCYGEAIGLLDKDRKDYEQLSNRSKILDELVPYTEAVHLQDSLQTLAKLPEKERNEAIDRVIEALKKKEKEERNKQAEAEAQSQLAQQGSIGNRMNNRATTGNTTAMGGQSGVWYFYNQMAVNQGKQAFQQQWGKRENVDNWQRLNKTVVAGAGEIEEWTDEQRDSIAKAAAIEDSLAQITDSAQNDPHKREYYLKDIPFTEEQVEASNLIIMDGLHHSGVIFKDKLDNLRLGERQLRRLTDQYPAYEQMDDVYYHLFLLYMRKGEPQMADVYLGRLKESYPESQWTALLSDPYFEENARIGTHMEDSLYAATYEAFKANRFGEVSGNVRLSERRFPLGANRDKFIFIGGLSKLNDGDSKGCLDDMQTVVDKYPQSDVSPLAGMIINGVKAGRPLRGGKFDMGDVWERRNYVLSDSDSIAARVFLPEREANFIFMIAYQPDSVNENQLLFELARFNFTNFIVRNFDIAIEDLDGLRRMQVAGFRSYDEALQYARTLYQQESITRLLQKARIIIISDKNMELLGTQFSYDDYDKFYERHFVPLKISTVRLLTEPATIEYEKQPDTPKGNDGQATDGLYNGGVLDNETLIDLGVEAPGEDSTFEIPTEEPANGHEDDSTIAVPQEENQPTPPVPVDEGTILVPQEDPTPPQKAVAPVSTETAPIVRQQPKTELPPPSVSPVKPVVPQPATPPSPATPAKQQPKTEDTGIDFEDGFGSQPPSVPKKQETKKKPVIDLEDEYYDLDGF